MQKKNFKLPNNISLMPMDWNEKLTKAGVNRSFLADKCPRNRCRDDLIKQNQ